MSVLNLSSRAATADRPIGAPPSTPTLEAPAGLKTHLGDLIDQAGRLRMLSHRTVMFLALSRDGDDRPLAEARKAFDAFERSARGFLGQTAAGAAPPAVQAWLAQMVQVRAPAYGPAAARFLRDVAGLTARGEGMSEANLARLAEFVAGSLLEALNGLVAVLNAELTALTDLERRQIQAAGATAASLLAEIEDIGAQVRMISINALIQATRAGEMGLGFAVIANEIKDLAARMQTAARRIAGDLQRALSA